MAASIPRSHLAGQGEAASPWSALQHRRLSIAHGGPANPPSIGLSIPTTRTSSGSTPSGTSGATDTGGRPSARPCGGFCVDPAAGFARVRCPDCRHEIFAAFSCRRRCLCPSCHQKRSLIFADQVAHEICALVPHRQYVFTIPKRLRIFFRFDRRLLGRLMRLAWETMNEAYRALLDRDDVVPGMIAGIQTFGTLAHFHPHVHAIVTDGVFVRDTAGRFICAPPLDMDKVRRLWEARVFHMLLEAGKIDLELVEPTAGRSSTAPKIPSATRSPNRPVATCSVACRATFKSLTPSTFLPS